jgi:hypothetical protein
MNRNRDLVGRGTLDLNPRDRCIGKFFVDVSTNQIVFGKNIFVIALSVPAGLPSLNDAKPVPDGIHFLSQKCPPFLAARVSRVI